MTGEATQKTPLGRDFWVVWTASTVSFIGAGVYFGGVPLLAAGLTRDARLISLVDAVDQVGWLLLGLVSGVLVDRWRRTAVMWRVDAARAAVSGVFAVLVLAGEASMALVLGVSFLLGLMTPFFDNASSSVLPELVPAEALERANSWSQTSLLLCGNLLGPPLGAAMFVLLPGLPIVVQAVSFMVAAALLFYLRRVGREPTLTDTRSLRNELAEGVRHLRNNRLLRTLCSLLAVLNIVSGGAVAILVLYVLEVMDLPQVVFGWLIAVFAVGGLLGAALASRVRRVLGVRASLVVGCSAFSAALAVMGLWPRPAPVVISVAVIGFSSVLWNVVTISLRQRIVPARLLGRVTSVYRVVGIGSMPVGSAGAGLLAHATSLRTVYVVGGLLLLTATLAAAPAISSGLARLDESPSTAELPTSGEVTTSGDD